MFRLEVGGVVVIEIDIRVAFSRLAGKVTKKLSGKSNISSRITSLSSHTHTHTHSQQEPTILITNWHTAVQYKARFLVKSAIIRDAVCQDNN